MNDFYIDLEKEVIDFPVFVKPYNGSASININKVNSKDELDLLFSKFDNLMIQEYMDGTEYGVDVYIDMISNEPVSIFIKEKIKMRAGETDKSVSVKDEKLLNLIQKFLKVSDYKGIIDIDVFKVNNKYYISEVNPRFGGGYPHAFECGVNIPRNILNNLKGMKNEKLFSNYTDNITMMKFNDLIIRGGVRE
ncbi:ATP-grasp domain-containing protein [Aerococcaceae bacterium DSM 111022]|nr:ATP-grasp domain-containing protein [Aerococcaceae bacterium DSM 111022]